jgi:hypothetical protein
MLVTSLLRGPARARAEYGLARGARRGAGAEPLDEADEDLPWGWPDGTEREGRIDESMAERVAEQEEEDRRSVAAAVACLRDHFHVPAVQVAHVAVLALHRAGQTTGVVVDIGLGTIRATPVLAGAVVPAGVRYQFNGSANITNLLLHELHDSLGREPVRAAGLCVII